MQTIRTIIMISLLSVLLAGCASLNSGYEPVVNVQSFRALPMENAGMPSFEVSLQVLNPNPDPLNLEGVFYTIDLEGQNLISGVANDLPVIEGYGEGIVKLTASVSLLGSIRLVQQLMSQPQEQVDYEFTARLDPVGFGRTIRVVEVGQISLTGQ